MIPRTVAQAEAPPAPSLHQPNPRRTPVDAVGRKVVVGQRYSYGDPIAGWMPEGEAVAFDGRGFDSSTTSSSA